MRRPILKKMSVEELIQSFVSIALAQDRALFEDDTATFNRLYDRMHNVELELKNRPGDQRQSLLRLYGHSNIQVRIKAAKSTLAVSPVAARALLQEIKDSGELPQSLEAGMSLWNLERGVFKPT
jgi:hypothetical protein